MNADEHTAWSDAVFDAKYLDLDVPKQLVPKFTILAADRELRLLGDLAAAADALLDVTVASTPNQRVSSIAREIGALHRAWKAWQPLGATEAREVGGGN